MYLEIVSPEATLLSGEVTSVSVPGVNGEFEMLNNHAPIVSILKEGQIKINGSVELAEEVESKFDKTNNGYTLAINSGTIAMKDNKVIILAD